MNHLEICVAQPDLIDVLHSIFRTRPQAPVWSVDGLTQFLALSAKQHQFWRCFSDWTLSASPIHCRKLSCEGNNGDGLRHMLNALVFFMCIPRFQGSMGGHHDPKFSAGLCNIVLKHISHSKGWSLSQLRRYSPPLSPSRLPLSSLSRIHPTLRSSTNCHALFDGNTFC